MTEGNGWAQLISLTDVDSDPIPITIDKVVIGRAADCDVCLSENKLVSSRHCFIQKDEYGTVTLNDTSTNGTLYNLSHKITKGKSKELAHGDEFYIVYKKNNEELNVGYVFQDMEELRKEMEAEDSSNVDNTMDATLEDVDCNYISPEKPEIKKRKSSVASTEDETPPKRVKSESNSEESKDNNDNNFCDKEGACSAKTDMETAEKSDKVTDKVKKSEAMSDTKGEATTEKKAKVELPARDDIEENLQCIICQEIMHDCISLQPCLHSFCAGCYSDWMPRSQECPSCRKKVERINKNHIVNNLIEAYLKVHPEKKRPEEDIKELNEKNKITNDMLYPQDNMRQSDSSDYSDEEDEDNDDDGTPALTNYVPPILMAPTPVPTLFGIGTPFFGTRQAKTMCRQCPGYRDPAMEENNNKNTGIIGGIVNTLATIKQTVTGTAGNNTGAGPTDDGPGTTGDNPDGPDGNNLGASTSGASKVAEEDVKVMPDPPPYVCPALQNHALCQCCFQPMPDRRNNPELPPQQCAICYRAYCHAYWGCRKQSCAGCLNIFKQMTFKRTALIGVILDNESESEIFRNYLDAKGMSVKDLLTLCCKGLDLGHYAVPAQGTHKFTSNSPTCYACGVNIFRQLAFQYRRTLKKEEFPEAVQNRPDCYWGSKCRTQRNKPHHAKNFNHVCDQTRQT